MTRRGGLLVFVDLPYAEGAGGVRCEDACWLFLEELGRGFERFEVLGRVLGRGAAPSDSCRLAESVRFHRLPSFSSEYALGEVVRALPALIAAAWEPLGRCDRVLLGAPGIWSLALWALAKVRGKDVAFLVRQDMPELVKWRAPARGRRLTLLGTRVLDAAFAALSRVTPAFVAGRALARRYRRAHPVVISTVRADEIMTRVRGDSRLLWVGRVDREKRPDLALEAFRELRERRGDSLELDVAGRGPLLGESEQLAKRLGVAERVRFHGHVPPGAELTRLYDSADVLVHSSASEGFPAVILEALARGLPVVTTAVGGIPESLEDGATAVLVPPHDPRALADGIERVLADPALRARLSAEGLAFARDHALEREVAAMLERWDSHARNPIRSAAP